jgi:hypothetical protein
MDDKALERLLKDINESGYTQADRRLLGKAYLETYFLTGLVTIEKAKVIFENTFGD